MTTILVSHPAFLDHDTGILHPEAAARLVAIDRVLEAEEFQMLVRQEASLRADDHIYIALAHSTAHHKEMASIASLVGADGTEIDGDTVVSSGTWEAARRAVGAGMDAVDMVMLDDIKHVFCQVRPPGHHAERGKAMGFCIFNNVAVAAHYARKKHGVERVAVVDFDVHHGNGTQDIFWSEKNLFYASTHQMPLFPWTGSLGETGVGNIFNAPLKEGDGRYQFEQAFRERVLAPLNNFAPDLVFISAGFDAHALDPLGGLQLVEDDFAWATREIAECARKHAGGRVISMLEGGYNLTALSESVAVHVRVLMETGF